MLVEMKLIKFDDRSLVAWVERNMADENAVRVIVANIHLLGADAAEFLEYSLLRQEDRLSPLLTKCWRLIVRYLRSAKHGLPSFEWINLQPRIRRGDHTTETISGLAELLRPKLTIGRRLSFRSNDTTLATTPTDLMSIEYSVDEDVSESEILDTWSAEASAEADESLLNRLAGSLETALADAVDIGIEGNLGWGISDSGVPSVAAHSQNEHRSGFLEITRVMAELWTRLAKKDSARSIRILDRWREGPFRLNRRLALYAGTNPSTAPALAADLLLELPLGELFLTNSAVEVYKLIKSRWCEFSAEMRERIEERLCSGPPRDWFREGAEIERHVDRTRFDLLGQMERLGLALNAKTLTVLREIRVRWPKWELRPEERGGFHTWSSGGLGGIGDAARLKDVPDENLVEAAARIDATTDIVEGSSWRALCRTDPDRALRALEAEANAGRWPIEPWTQFFWENFKLSAVDISERIIALILKWPSESFPAVVHVTSSWLTSNFGTVVHEDLWALWDRIFETGLNEEDEASHDDDPLNAAINSPAGHLVEILLGKLLAQKSNAANTRDLTERMDRLVTAEGRFGLDARVRIAAEVSLLFNLIPEWTKKQLVPLFAWSSADAPSMWSARSYSSYVGVPALIQATKEPFLELFSRPNTPQEQLSHYAEWLAAIAIANQAHDADYPITMTETRSALRKAGDGCLPHVAHSLANEMERAKPEDKVQVWQNIVCPVLQGIWPLDIELQTAASTFKLVQILRATGAAFPQAAEVIIPFIRPDHPGRHTSVFSITTADDILFTTEPAKMLELLSAVVGKAPPASVYSLQHALDRVIAADPTLTNSITFQRLRVCAAP